MDAYNSMLSRTSSSFQDFMPSHSEMGGLEVLAGAALIASVLIPGVAEVEIGAGVVDALIQTYSTTATIVEGITAIDKGLHDTLGTESKFSESWEKLANPVDSITSNAITSMLPGTSPGAASIADDVLTGKGIEGAAKILNDIPIVDKALESEPPKTDGAPVQIQEKQDSSDDSDYDPSSDMDDPDDSDEMG